MPNSSGFSGILKQHLGNEWLAYLRQAGISYCIRCKENAQIAGKGGTRQALNGHFRALKTGEGKRLGPVMLYGQQHYLEATRLTDGQLLVVCSDKEGKGIEAYGERWQIKTLFGSLKSKGFNLEDTHMTAPAKIDRLMSVLAIGFVLSCRAVEAEDIVKHLKNSNGSASTFCNACNVCTDASRYSFLSI